MLDLKQTKNNVVRTLTIKARIDKVNPWLLTGNKSEMARMESALFFSCNLPVTPLKLTFHKACWCLFHYAQIIDSFLPTDLWIYTNDCVTYIYLLVLHCQLYLLIEVLSKNCGAQPLHTNLRNWHFSISVMK